MEAAKNPTAPPSYAKYAFTDQHNLVLLFGAASFSVAFASPLPILAGAAGEVAWLVLGSRVPAFRKRIDGRLDAQRRARADDALDATLAELPATYSRRFLSLRRGTEEILTLARNRSDMPAAELQRTELGLSTVRSTFLDYQLLSRKVTSLIDATPIAALEEEAAWLQEAYAADKDLSVRMTIRKSLTQNQRQQQQHQQLTRVERAIELRLTMIEKALSYLKGRVTDAASNQVCHELDNLLSEVGAAAGLEPAIDEALSAPGPTWPQI